METGFRNCGNFDLSEIKSSPRNRSLRGATQQNVENLRTLRCSLTNDHFLRKFLQTIVSFIIIHRANDKIPLPEFDETRESAGSKEKEIL